MKLQEHLEVALAWAPRLAAFLHERFPDGVDFATGIAYLRSFAQGWDDVEASLVLRFADNVLEFTEMVTFLTSQKDSALRLQLQDGCYMLSAVPGVPSTPRANTQVFRETIDRIFDQLAAGLCAHATVGWDEVVFRYVEDFNGYNPMTTSQRLIEVMRSMPLLTIPNTKGEWYVLQPLFEDPYNPLQSRVRMTIQRKRKVRVIYRMEVQAICNVAVNGATDTAEFMVPPPEFGEFVDQMELDDEL